MVSTSHPFCRVGLDSTITGTAQKPDANTSGVPAYLAAIVLVLDNVECFTTKVSLRSTSCRGPTPRHLSSSRKHSHGRTTIALLPSGAREGCVSYNNNGLWTVACRNALKHTLAVHENYNLDIVSVLYSVGCDIRVHCLSKTGTTTYRPSCQFYEHLIDSGKARAIGDCTKSKRMGVTAGLELKVAASDKILLGMQYQYQ
jgi:hypothetical protein